MAFEKWQDWLWVKPKSAVSDVKVPFKEDVIQEPNETLTLQTANNSYAGWIIYIDPGHGSTTAGKRSPDGKLLEYRHVREIATYMEEYLNIYGIKHKRTVDTDADKGLTARASFANNDMYMERRTDPSVKGLFVSIHSNAAANGTWQSAKGWSVWTTKGQNNSDKLAEFMCTSFENHLPEINDIGAKYGVSTKLRTDRSDGDRDYESDFTVIKVANMPAVLVENLFHDNKEDATLLLDKSVLRLLGQVLAEGVKMYIESL